MWDGGGRELPSVIVFISKTSQLLSVNRMGGSLNRFFSFLRLSILQQRPQSGNTALSENNLDSVGMYSLHLPEKLLGEKGNSLEKHESPPIFLTTET